MSIQQTIPVVGGAGLPGFALVRYLVGKGGIRIHNIDKLTRAGNTEWLPPITGQGNCVFERQDQIIAAMPAFQL